MNAASPEHPDDESTRAEGDRTAGPGSTDAVPRDAGDELAGAPAPGRADAVPHDAGDERARVARAEQLFVDALLTEAMAGSPAERNARLAHLLESLPARRARVLRPSFWIGFAAAIVLVGFFFWLRGGTAPEPLLAFVRKAAAESFGAGDRRYEMIVEARHGTRTLGFWSRGRDHFVLELPSPLGLGPARLGRTPKGAWFVPALPRKPVVVTDQPTALSRLIEGQGLDLATMDARELLEELDEGWQLERVQDDVGSGQLRIRAERSDVLVGAAHRVEILADQATGKIRELRSFWRPLPGMPGGIVTLRLQSEEALPPDWFEHESHHRPRRPVVDLAEFEDR